MRTAHRAAGRSNPVYTHFMRLYMLLCILLPITGGFGCIGITNYPARELEFEVTNAERQRIHEWWVLSWREDEWCHVGCVWKLHGLNMSPHSRSTEHLQLLRMTPHSNEMTWPRSYEVYMWYLVLLPPGGAWKAFTWFKIFASGEPGEWSFEKGTEFPWKAYQTEDGAWKVTARNIGMPRDPTSSSLASGFWGASAVIELIPVLEEAGHILRKDKIEFVELVITNLESAASAAPENDISREKRELESFLERLRMP